MMMTENNETSKPPFTVTITANGQSRDFTGRSIVELSSKIREPYKSAHDKIMSIIRTEFQKNKQTQGGSISLDVTAFFSPSPDDQKQIISRAIEDTQEELDIKKNPRFSLPGQSEEEGLPKPTISQQQGPLLYDDMEVVDENTSVTAGELKSPDLNYTRAADKLKPSQFKLLPAAHYLQDQKRHSPQNDKKAPDAKEEKPVPLITLEDVREVINAIKQKSAISSFFNDPDRNPMSNTDSFTYILREEDLAIAPVKLLLFIKNKTNERFSSFKRREWGSPEHEYAIMLKIEFLNHLYTIYAEQKKIIEILNQLNSNQDQEKKQNFLPLFFNNRKKQTPIEKGIIFLDKIKWIIDGLMQDLLVNKNHTARTIISFSKGNYIKRMPEDTKAHQTLKLMNSLSRMVTHYLSQIVDLHKIDDGVSFEHRGLTKDAYFTVGGSELVGGKKFLSSLNNLYKQAGYNQWKYIAESKKTDKLEALKNLSQFNSLESESLRVAEKELGGRYYYILPKKYQQALITLFVCGVVARECNDNVKSALNSILLPAVIADLIRDYINLLEATTTDPDITMTLVSIRECIKSNKQKLNLSDNAIRDLDSAMDINDLEIWINTYWDIDKNDTLKNIYSDKNVLNQPHLADGDIIKCMNFLTYTENCLRSGALIDATAVPNSLLK